MDGPAVVAGVVTVVVAVTVAVVVMLGEAVVVSVVGGTQES